MDAKKLREKLEGNGCHISKYCDRYLEGTKSFLGTLDFKCDFVDGYCKRRRGHDYISDTRREMCCCMGCFHNVGYLHHIVEEHLPIYARHFNGKTGFWRKGKGCILPYHLRSTTCVTYNCVNYDNDKEKITATGLSCIAEFMRNRERKNESDDRRRRRKRK